MLRRCALNQVINCARNACYGGRHTVTVIPGDGIGPEMIPHVKQAIEWLAAPIDFEEANLDKDGSCEEAALSIKRTGVCLKGNVITNWPAHDSRNLRLRAELDLFANVVHAKSFEGVHTRHNNIDIVVVRENTEGEYSALSHSPVPGCVESLKICTRRNSERIAMYAFDYATKWGRKKVTCVHKANIMKQGDGLFLKVCREVAQLYPQIEFNDMIVDNTTMQLVSNPSQFDVMVTPNLYGNIIQNMACGMIGGPGLVSGGNFSSDVAVFEQATRNTGRKICGQNIANPTAYLIATSKMLRHLGLTDYGVKLRSAVEGVINEDRIFTHDIGGIAKTSDFMNALGERLTADH